MDWKVDPNSGRRYREFGAGCIEYETDYVFSGNTERQPEKRQPVEQQRKCPFKSIVNNNCAKERCAFYIDGCVLAKTDQKPARETAGLRCPVNKEARKCETNCALYRGGCLLTAARK